MMRRTLRSRVTRQRAFGRESPVLDYWVGHSEGFRLITPDGRGRGDVEGVVVDELGRPRALVVRSTLLQRPQLVDVRAVEAVVPSSRTITVRDETRRRSRRRPAASVARATASGAPVVRTAVSAVGRTAWASLTLAAATLRWSGRRVRRYAPVVARRSGRAAAATAAWTRPRAGRLARLGAAAAVTVMLFLVTLAHAVAVATAASARLVARDWRRRTAARRGRMSAAQMSRRS